MIFPSISRPDDEKLSIESFENANEKRIIIDYNVPHVEGEGEGKEGDGDGDGDGDGEVDGDGQEGQGEEDGVIVPSSGKDDATIINELQGCLNTILTKFKTTKKYSDLATPIKTLLDNWEKSTSIIAQKFATEGNREELKQHLTALITVEEKMRESVPAIPEISRDLAIQLNRIETVPFNRILTDPVFQGALTSSGHETVARVANAKLWAARKARDLAIYAAVGASVNFTDHTNLWTFLVENKKVINNVMKIYGIEEPLSGGKNTRKNKRSRGGNRQKYGRKNKGRSLRKNKRSSRKKKSKQNKYLLRKNLKHSKKKN